MQFHTNTHRYIPEKDQVSCPSKWQTACIAKKNNFVQILVQLFCFLEKGPNMHEAANLTCFLCTFNSLLQRKPQSFLLLYSTVYSFYTYINQKFELYNDISLKIRYMLVFQKTVTKLLLTTDHKS